MAHEKIRIVGLLLALVLAAGAAHAQDDDEDAFDTGAYLTLAGNNGIELFENDASQANDDLGLAVKAGFRFLRYASAEMHYEYFPGFDTSSKKRRVQTIGGNVKGFLVNDNTGPFEPYALVGIGALFSHLDNDDDQGFFVRGGGGINMKLSDNVSLVAEGSYVYPTFSGNVDDLEYVSVLWGIQLGF